MIFPAPQKLQLAQLPTPFQSLDRLSAYFGGPKIWIKRDDLTHTSMSGNKLRKLEFVTAEAKRQGCQVLITCGGIQSNHCRATALICAQLGLQCHLVLRGGQPEELDGNTLLAGLAGATISYVPPKDYQSQLSSVLADLVAAYAAKGSKAYAIPTGASDEVGLWGYYTMALELLRDFDRHNTKFDFVCCATGSGGTHAGLALGLHHLDFRGTVRGYAVCDNSEYFVRKAKDDIARWYRRYFTAEKVNEPRFDVNDKFIGQGYGIASDDVLATIRLVSSMEGVILDPVYTGKAFHGMLAQLQAGDLDDFENLVFVHTGGIFGLFPFKTRLSQLD